MGSHRDNMTLRGENSKVATAPAENEDAALVGSFVNADAPERAMLLTDGENFNFATEGDRVEAMRGYFDAGELHSRVKLNYASLDDAYRLLAQTIDEAYDRLKRYAEVADEEAYDAYLDAIHEAEREFSYRPSSTLNTDAKIRAYCEQLVASGNEYILKSGDNVAVEIDMTAKLRNPSFETKSTAGWTFTAPLNANISASTAARVYPNTNYNYLTVGADGDYVFNSSYQYANASGERQTLGVGISQQVEGLKPGYYRLEVMLASDEDNEITAFAGDSTLTVKAHSFGKHYFTEAVIDRVKVEAADGETGQLTVGVMAGSWYKADHFRLTYLGSKADEGHISEVGEIAVAPRKAPKGIYTIQGQRIGRITAPGIYIIDGRKVMRR